MTNNITQYVPGHFSSTERHLGQLPALLSSRWFNSIFDDVLPEKLVEDQHTFYPCNILVTKDDEGEIKKYTLEVALAGIGRDNINIDIKDDVLTVQVSKEDKDPEEGHFYLKRGISRRKSTFSYKLDTNQVNIKNIQSTYIDGLLTVTLPVKKKEIHKIDIKVNID